MRAMVIHSDQRYSSADPFTGIATPFPPIGTTGTVIADIDEDGDYEVIFDDWPPVSAVDPGWFAHKSMLVFIDGRREAETRARVLAKME